jgi:hypothetical protein
LVLVVHELTWIFSVVRAHANSSTSTLEKRWLALS